MKIRLIEANSYNISDTDPVNADALFVTINGGFGGYSQAAAHGMAGYNFIFAGNRSELKESADINLKTLRYIQWMTNNKKPVVIATSQVSGYDISRKLMLEILFFSDYFKLRDIRLLQLIHLNSSQLYTFKGISDALKAYFNDNETTSQIQNIIFDIDNRYANDFQKMITP